MNNLCAGVVLVGVVGLRLVGAQTSTGKVVEKFSPALDALISSEAKLELLSDRFTFIEGPLWVDGPPGQSGYLLFSDIPENVVYKWTSDGKASIFVEPSGFTGKPEDLFNIGAQMRSGRVNVIMYGTNGLALDPQGRLIMAAVGDRAVVRLEKDGTRTVLFSGHEGKRFGGPNDFAAKSNGALYFTDTTGSLRGREKSPLREIPYTGLYLLKDGQIRLLDKETDDGQANGVALSPDEKHLYVGLTPGKYVLRYDVQPDETLANRRVLIDSMGSDGLEVDSHGNLWTTARGAVWISSPDGKQLGKINIPSALGVNPTNVAFGDADRRTLYITAVKHLYRIRLNVEGLRVRARP
jgi:gluconolactonase